MADLPPRCDANFSNRTRSPPGTGTKEAPEGQARAASVAKVRLEQDGEYHHSTSMAKA